MVTREQEQLLNDIAENADSVVTIGKKKFKVGWLKRGTLRKFTNIMLNRKDDLASESKVTCKLAAVVRLNGYWSIKFFYSFVWRWYYYIKQYNDDVLLPIIEEGKKKVQLQEYYTIMMLSQGLKDTHKTMTREEVNRMLQELQSAQKEQ
jgi:hypothetical protein